MNAETLKELLANVTPGPWEAHADDQGGTGRDAYVCIDDGCDVVAKAMCNTARSLKRKPYEANAALIALAPQLAADNIALQVEVERLREIVEELADVGVTGFHSISGDWFVSRLLVKKARAALNETKET